VSGDNSVNGRPLPKRLTLAGLFVVTIGGVTLIVAALFAAFLESSQASMLHDAELANESAAMRVEADVHGDLHQGTHTLENIERAIQNGVVDASNAESLETLLFTELLDNPQVAAVTLTHATKLGVEADGNLTTESRDRWQLTVFRSSSNPGSPIVTRRVRKVDGHFMAAVREQSQGLGPGTGAPQSQDTANDPTESAAFRMATKGPAYGQTIYSDLSYAERDEDLPPERRRVVETVEKAIEDRAGSFVGVLRVGLLAQVVDDVARLKVNPRDPSDPHRIFLCDSQGRLVTRMSKSDRFVLVDGVLRVEAESVPPPIAVALKSPLLRALGPKDRDRSDVLRVGDEPYLATFHWLSREQDWVVGIVVPEDYYVHQLRVLRDRFLTAYAIVTALILGGGFWVLRAIRRGLGLISDTTAQMRRFDFSPSEGVTAFNDVQETIDGLERAKTVVRAMEKYVPIDLVRELYATNREPVLGGKLHELSIMFSDIRDFTPLSERLAPDDLARVLGRYFETMTAAVTAAGGTVDKFIGDSIMAFWNAPGARPDHAALACRAALDCLAATRRLYASKDWSGLQPLFTRFGIHTDTVLVGHFGAPARLSYTALGDGVNLAARLESLCKLYNVAVLVSEAVELRARDGFVFRLIDTVAVKGKTKAVGVYELLGAVTEEPANLGTARTYERAYRAYLQRDFRAALALLESCEGDGPSEVLAERCRRYLVEPPPPEWDGSFRADHK
jgi:adenylate cyclase